MARKELRQIALDDGANYNSASCFAECCINILQLGCRYPKGVEKKIQRLLKDRGGVCSDIILRMNAPRSGMKKTRNLGPPPKGYKIEKDKDGFPYFVYIEKSQHDRGRKRWRSPTNDRTDHERPIYYEDRNPHGYNQRRPYNSQYQYNQRNQRRGKRRPNPNQMGRMEPKRGRTLSRPTKIQRKS